MIFSVLFLIRALFLFFVALSFVSFVFFLLNEKPSSKWGCICICCIMV